MKTVILDGNLKSGNSPFDIYMKDFCTALSRNKILVKRFLLRDMDLKCCTGCWSCWTKTPGRCAIKDDAEQIYPEIIDADLLVYASPIVCGFVTSRLKTIQDRLIPLILPYITFVHGEMHHVKRYPSYPAAACIFSLDDQSDTEDFEITSRMYRRFAINTWSDFLFAKTTETPPEEAADAAALL